MSETLVGAAASAGDPPPAGRPPASVSIVPFLRGAPPRLEVEAQELDSRRFLFLRAGAGTAEFDSTIHPLRPGALVMIAPGRFADLQLDPDAEGVWMVLSEVFFGAEVIRAMPGLAAHPVYSNETYYRSEVIHHFEEDRQDGARERIFQELSAAADRLGIGCDPAIAAYALVILFGEQWRRMHGARRVALSDARDLSEGELVNYFRQMVGLNFSRHLRVQDYCHSMAVSHDRLTDACKALLKLTPSQVIQQRLVLEAKRALLHSSRPISQIAYDLGFTDVGYFSRFIRVRTGLSPKALRRQGAPEAVE